MNRFPLFILIISMTMLFSCSEKKEFRLTDGVSFGLAEHRKKTIKNVEYNLFFDIPSKIEKCVSGEANILFDVEEKENIILDFKSDLTQINMAIVNGDFSDVITMNEHIIIPANDVVVGRNNIVIYFEAPSTSLNRRDDMMYTLLVPDRARTLFPCFDQPNIKAKFSLKLAIPDGWRAVSNGSIKRSERIEETRSRMFEFHQTEPISTYLFSFVAGKFYMRKYKKDDREVNIFYRTKDKHEKSQLKTIADEVFYSLNWLEDYTDIKYPFEKYDLVIIPGFQYGGMEHVGATLYNARRMFIPKNAPITSVISRSALIAHETAHMWFGDLVTMDWFDDVWNKEVFANYYANDIALELYPEVDNRVSFAKYFKKSYEEDRTQGTNALTQKLDNLQDAGLVYGNIIYNKAPVIMQMLVQKMGKEAYDNGVRDYLKKYSYGNATWNDLIHVLDEFTHHDLIEWSKVWVEEKGMPTIETEVKNDSLFIVQVDPLGRGLNWQQEISFLAIGDDFKTPVTVNLTKISDFKELPEGTKYIIPNYDMKAYGFFVLNSHDILYARDSISVFDDPIIKTSILTNLHENALNQNISPESYAQTVMNYILKEDDQILFLNAMNNLYYCYNQMQLKRKKETLVEMFLWNMAINSDVKYRQTDAINKLISGAKYNSTKATLLRIYQGKHEIKIDDEDRRISLCYNLAIWFPELADELVASQLLEIKNKDKLAEFKFVSKSVSPDVVVRDSVFNALLNVEKRSIEPWVTTTLGLLNHKDRLDDAIKYIKPGLEIMPEIHSTGDIFFPKSWSNALLRNHKSEEARLIVEQYIKNNEHEIEPMLMNKIKLASYNLMLNN